MTQARRALVRVLLTILAVVPAIVHADNVQLSVGGGRLSLVAVNATPAQIFDAWSKAGNILVVNADRLSGPPLTLTLENVPEEQALDTLLRPVTGYLARRRTSPAPSASIFDRIVIVPTPAGARPATTPAAPPPFAAPPAPGPALPPATPAAPPPGPARIIGPDGQPVEDDQAGAPPPPPSSAAGDAPDARTPPSARGVPMPQPQPAPTQPSAPAGVPRPGMVVPGPQGAGQPR